MCSLKSTLQAVSVCYVVKRFGLSKPVWIGFNSLDTSKGFVWTDGSAVRGFAM